VQYATSSSDDAPTSREVEVVPRGAHGDPRAPRFDAGGGEADLERLLGGDLVLAPAVAVRGRLHDAHP
jgi:hypothetical protein